MLRDLADAVRSSPPKIPTMAAKIALIIVPLLALLLVMGYAVTIEVASSCNWALSVVEFIG
jgi:hypothetical protein